jgi:hypothetical protein
MAFTAAWQTPLFQPVRMRPNIRLHDVKTASHSFADAASRHWLYDHVADVLQTPD